MTSRSCSKMSQPEEMEFQIWAESLVGRFWEVYWQEEHSGVVSKASPSLGRAQESNGNEEGLENPPGGSSKRSVSQQVGLKKQSEDSRNEDDRSDATEHEEDWYEAQVLSYQPKGGDERGSFQVSFVGDDENVYEMSLIPQIVRPSTQAWIDRTKAILAGEHSLDEGTAMEVGERTRQWILQLPTDTRLPKDQSALEAIQQQLTAEKEQLRGSWSENDDKTRTEHQLSAVHLILTLVEQQKYLRGDLVPEEKNYVSFLNECLDDLGAACQWFLECWNVCLPLRDDSVQKVHSPSAVNDLLARGRTLLVTLIENEDTSPTAIPAYRIRKRRRNEVLPTSRRPKRQRRNQAQEHQNGRFDDFSFDSPEAIEKAMTQLRSSGSRFFLELFTNMLACLHTRILVPLRNWQKLASVCLCEYDPSSPENHYMSSSDDISEDGDASLNGPSVHAPHPESDTSLMTYDEIAYLIHCTRTDSVLRRFELTSTLLKLQEKLHAIETFARKVQGAIENMFLDTERPDIKHDESFNTLKKLNAEMDAKESPLRNVLTFAPSPTSLKRDLLGECIRIRRWFLDLTHIEKVREQTSFVEKIVKEYAMIVPFEDSEVTDRITTEMLGLADRVKILDSKLASNGTVYERFLHRINHRSGDDFESMTNLSTIEKALDQLRASPFICIAEELLSVRSDVIKWRGHIETLLNDKTRPSFSDMSNANDQLTALLQGKSSMRLQLLDHVKGDEDVTAEVCRQASVDIDLLAAEGRSSFIEAYVSSASWKEQAESIISNLRAFGHPLAGAIAPLNTQAIVMKAQGMVDMEDLSGLVDRYERLVVDMDDLQQILLSIKRESLDWRSTVTSLLLSNECSYEEMLQALSQKAEERPKGLIIHPASDVIESVMELLTWHRDCKDLFSTMPIEGLSILLLINEGWDILEEFYNDRNAKFFVAINDCRHSLPESRREISLKKLTGNALSCKFLRRMLEDKNGVENLFLTMIYILWSACVDSMMQNLKQTTLAAALELYTCRPTQTEESSLVEASSSIAELERLIADSQEKESSIIKAIKRSEDVAKDWRTNRESILSQEEILRRLLRSFKGRDDAEGLALDQELNTKLEANARILGWLTRISQYPILLNEGNVVCSKASDEKLRIPWQELESVYKSIPCVEDAKGDLAHALHSVEYLHAAACQWLSLFSSSPDIDIMSYSEATQINGNPSTDRTPIGELPCDSLFRKVVMPNEDAMRQLHSRLSQFTQLLGALLSPNVEHNWAHHVAVPGELSFVSRDGSFQVLHLTENEHFRSLKQSIKAITHSIADVHVNVRGRVAFQWIRSAIEWVEQLRNVCINSSSSNSGLPQVALPIAQKLLQNAEERLLHIPEDLQHTLAMHHVSITLSDSKEIVVTMPDLNEQCAFSVAVLQWFSKMLSSLRQEAGKTQDWVTEFNNVSKELSAAYHDFNSRKLSPFNSICVSKYLLLRDEMNGLLTGLGKLTVVPEASTVSLFHTTRQNIVGYLSSYAAKEILQTHTHTSFLEPSRLVENRTVLLDALFDRFALDTSVLTTEEEDDSMHLRTNLRNLLDKALQKALICMEIAVSAQMTTFCSMKAWEVELTLHELYPVEISGDANFISYRDQGRAIKRAMEDPGNLLLCVQILTGEVEAEKLVRMTSEDLAPQRLKEDRANATEIARQRLTLTKPEVDQASSKKDEALTIQVDDRLRKKEFSSRDLMDTDEQGVETTIIVPESSLDEDIVLHAAHPLTEIAKRSLGTLGQLVKKASQRPLPPPSLASLSASAPGPGTTPTPPLEQLLAAEESGSVNRLAGWIDQQLIEVARVPVSEFSKFLQAKLASGRNEAIALRVVTESSADQQEYSKFCRMYEEKGRIAMISLDDVTKLYLLTPRFLKSARKYISFQEVTSPYAVVITKS